MGTFKSDSSSTVFLELLQLHEVCLQNVSMQC
jgi:hypothetical protein